MAFRAKLNSYGLYERMQILLENVLADRELTVNYRTFVRIRSYGNTALTLLQKGVIFLSTLQVSLSGTASTLLIDG